MNKTIRLILVVLIAGIFIGLIIFVTKMQYEQNKKEQQQQLEEQRKASSNLNKIDTDEFVELLNSNDTQIILIASLECPHCTLLKPKINEIAKELNVKISYLELTTMSEDDYKKFYSSNNFFAESTSIPIVVAVKDNEIVDSFVGNVDKEVAEEFVKTNLNIN